MTEVARTNCSTRRSGRSVADVFEDARDYGRIECPGCGNYLSDILAAFRDGRPCPRCGLPSETARQVYEARRSGVDEELERKYLDALKRAIAAEAEARELRERIDVIREAATR
jgi:hypothetical protein